MNVAGGNVNGAVRLDRRMLGQDVVIGGEIQADQLRRALDVAGGTRGAGGCDKCGDERRDDDPGEKRSRNEHRPGLRPAVALAFSALKVLVAPNPKWPQTGLVRTNMTI